MNFMFRLLGRFRKTPAATAVTEDLFEARLRRMRGRNRLAPKGSPFRSQRSHPAT